MTDRPPSPNPLPTTEQVTQGWPVPDGWKLIGEHPSRPMPVIFFSAGLTYWSDKEPTIMPDYTKGEAYNFGYWDGVAWVYSMTNHDVFEFRSPDEADDLPTHWMPLPPPPGQ